MPDAVVIGAGHNGLVAANLLADDGWDVVVLEAESEPGGAVRSAQLTLPGFIHDPFSSFYPLAAVSRPLRALRLGEHGLRWRRPDVAVAHPDEEGRVAYVAADPDETAASFDAFAAGDGDAWRRLYELWLRVGDALLDALFTPFPPVRASARLAGVLGARGLLDFARFGTLPNRRLAQERFAGEGAARMLAGNALHADLSPEQPGGALFGWLLCSLAQQVGYPVAAGGSGAITAALVDRLTARGGKVVCDARVEEIVVRRRRAVGVRTRGGDQVGAKRAVLADVDAPQLYLRLLDRADLPPEVVAAVRRFEWDNATFRLDWALDGPVPWTAAETARAGTVHLSPGLDALTRWSTELVLGQVPAEPFLVCGQYARTDASRQPPGKETFSAYTHVPQQVRGDAGAAGLSGGWDTAESERFAERMEAQVERVAPGFRNRILARSIMSPGALQTADANLHRGALNGGTAKLHQQLIFRPIPGLGRSETPIAGLYLASASAHPGGGVHGGPGANAARAARREPRLVQRAAARLVRATAGAPTTHRGSPHATCRSAP